MIESGFADGEIVVREQLPKTVRPLHYHLTLTPNFSDFTFDGKEDVEIVIVEPTNRIMLHAAELTINAVTLTRAWGATHKSIDITYDEKKETVMFLFSSLLVPGIAQLHIQFSGTLNDQMRGFYRSTHTVAGEEHIMAVTQFEAADARRAFPCWDEPAIKAQFSLTLKVPRGYDAISNMPVEKETWGATRNIHFEPTPVMSTYLLAIAVGEFEYIEAATEERTLVCVIAPIGKNVAKRGQFALGVATKVLSFYNDYFGISYPLPKIDLLAVPDFASGAMENWGLVTYRETAILFDPDESSAATKQRVALVIAHELAHQWFGNLVTMKWWTDLWLNEGFASWIEYLALDYLFPEWKMWTQFVTADMVEALRLDALENSHPIEVPVSTPAQISETFDAISYSKGASVIRMLHAYLGEEAFRKGLQDYLARYQYGNATTDDLWAALSETSGKPVKEMMDCWTKQTGYPVVNIYTDKISAIHKDHQGLVCFQWRFLANGAIDETRWHIPFAINGPAINEPICNVFTKGTKQIAFEIPAIASDGWINGNPGQVGFWRVCYRGGLFEKLIPAVKSQILTPEERFGLQNDTFALARAGYMSATKTLELFEAYREETEYAVWTDLAANLRELKTLWAWEPYYEQFCAFARELFKPIATRMGWKVSPDDDHQVRLLRALALGAFGVYGDPLTIDLARYYFSCFLNSDHNMLHPDLRGLVYHLVIKNGDEKTYANVLGIYRETDLQEEKIRCLAALGASQDHSLLKRALVFSLSPEVRSQDTAYSIMNVAANRHGRELAWQFLQENWAEFDRRYGDGKFFLRWLISSCTEDFMSEEKAQEVEAFFRDHPVPAASRTILQSLERIRSNAAWLARDRDDVTRWFEKRMTNNK